MQLACQLDHVRTEVHAHVVAGMGSQDGRRSSCADSDIQHRTATHVGQYTIERTLLTQIHVTDVFVSAGDEVGAPGVRLLVWLDHFPVRHLPVSLLVDRWDIMYCEAQPSRAIHGEERATP